MSSSSAETLRKFMKNTRSFYRGLFPFYKEKNVHPHDIVDWIKLEAQNEVKSSMHFLGINIRHHFAVEMPFSGVTIVALGNADKYLRYLKFLEATHMITVKMGEATATHENSSPVTETKSFDHVTAKLIEDACLTFIGDYPQVYPHFIKRTEPIIDQNIWYEEDERRFFSAKRPVPIYLESKVGKDVTISNISLTDFRPPCVTFSITADPSFNGRAFARDLGNLLDTNAHVTDFCRLSIGPVSVKDCLHKHELYKDDMKRSTDEHTLKLVESVRPYLDRYILYREKRM